MTYDQLVAAFNEHGHWVKTPDNQLLGKGLFESILVEQGFDKSELKKLVKCSILKKFQVKLNGELMNSYVLPLGGLQCQDLQT